MIDIYLFIYLFFQIQLKMKGGLGLSVIQQTPPQELIYAKLSDIMFEYQSSLVHRSVACSIRDIQVRLGTDTGEPNPFMKGGSAVQYLQEARSK